LYLLACAAFPFGNCRRCHGTGKRRAPIGRAFRLCRRCEGTGRRVRIGRRIWTFIRTEREKGNR
jgi:DnaJ-class molecular chaperone